MCGEQKSTSEAASQELSRWLFQRRSLTSLKLAGEARGRSSKLGGSADLCVSCSGITSSHSDTGGFFFSTWMLELQTQALMSKASTLSAEQSPNLRTVDL